MDRTLSTTMNKSGLAARLVANPVVRILLGVFLTFAAIPLTMITASQLVEKPYRVAWPQLLAAVLVWFGYRFWVRHIEKRTPAELAMSGMARELGLGLAIGAGLVASTFVVLAALGSYHLLGLNAPGVLMLIPLAELVLVGMAEEMVFRGVVFGVAERSLGSRAAIVISAFLFCVAHLPNDGISVLAVVALVAYGVMQAAIYMKTRSLWACIGTHVGWNFVLGQVFSSAVSGQTAGHGLLKGELSGDVWLTGGSFGVEGSLVTVLLIGATAAFWLRRAFADQTQASLPA